MTEKLTKNEMRTLVTKIFAKIMYYSNWKAETPNEIVLQNLMEKLGLYPFQSEDEMIYKTKVDDDLYHQILKQ